jgi:hypothetical protein
MQKKPKSKMTWIAISLIPTLILIALIAVGGSTKASIFPKLNPNTTTILFWIAFAIPFMTAFILIFRVFLKPFKSFFGGGRDTKRILSTGMPAQALIKQIGESSIGGALTINEQPYLNLQLEVREGTSPPYTVSLDTIIPRSAVPRFQPGALIPVRIDPADPQKVVIDWSGGVDQGSPPAAAAATPTVGNIDGWTQQDNQLLDEQGIDGSAKLLSIEDTGKSLDFNPVVKISYEIRGRNIDTYSFSKEVPLPTQTINMLKKVIRKSFPARIHPHDRTKIKVNVTF